MPRYRRYWLEGGTYFFTVNLLERQSSLLTEHIALLRQSVAITKQRMPFHIDAWVVLPDHIHAVWTLPEGDCDFSTRWRLIKFGFSRAQASTERRSNARSARAERGIWQRRFWEHAIRDEQDYANHVDYVHFNPLKHGLVARVADWPYSTFHRYVADGRYPPDWCGSREVSFPTGELT
ncbi:REP-associated tyrosine transposase [Permianibacter aggregans]|uniref:Putative transposase n=1 Tax=Permianibacter aggregans TaxID=1510150 RepID=A0A4R6UNP0_9GAMM|nr:transposase [Permianibacter aggregans]QGX39774.1 transposase [Permianibacter aggregans]TDQ47103.1 putative transposase [Permianibacter aggregans]